MHWCRYTCLDQGPVQDRSQFADRERSIDLLAVDEHRRSRFHAQCFGLVDRSFHVVVLLGFDTGQEFCPIQIMLLTLRLSHAIERGELTIVTFF